MPTRGRCRLCHSPAELRDSHVIPNFVFRWLRKSSGGAAFRFGQHPNKVLQDGYKKKLLCESCETKFSRWEKTFSEKIFHPYIADSSKKFRYGDWLIRFCVSVNWRALIYMSEEHGFSHFPPELQDMVPEAERTWRLFLLGEIEHPASFRQQFLPLDAIESHTIRALPETINRYFLRAVDIDAAHGNGEAFIYLKIPRFVLVGIIRDEHRNYWRGTEVRLRQGVVGSREYQIPKPFGEYLIDRGHRMKAVLSGVSERQTEKTQERLKQNIDAYIQSDALKAFLHDLGTFGDGAFIGSARKDGNEE